MPDWLNSAERNALELVLEPRGSITHKGNPGILGLSLYSSELKNLRQLAEQIGRVADSTFAKHDDRTRSRYFRSLRINGVAEGTADAPLLTADAAIVLTVAQNDNGGASYWHDNRDQVETPLFRSAVQRLASGTGTSPDENWKSAFFNVQSLLDWVPEADLTTALNDLELVKVLQFINSSGLEIVRFFRLSSSEQTDFLDAFKRVLATGDQHSGATHPIEQRAYRYYQGSKTYQADVRFRVAAFMRAFITVRTELGSAFPRLDRSLNLVSGTSVTSAMKAPTATPSTSAAPAPIGPRQLIVSGCPGSGKSFWLDQQIEVSKPTVVRTQFHAETSYYDFVGSYRPVPVYEQLGPGATLHGVSGNPVSHGRPLINYEFAPGPFVRALTMATNDPSQNVVLVIEEINRGNCAAIFGDMFQLLDRQNDGSSRYRIAPTAELHGHLALHSALDANSQLGLPSNLYIWATMNSADQGVFPLDTAFRRRWDFLYRGHAEPCAYAESDRLVTYGSKAIDWDIFRTKINTKLQALGVHEDKLIGPYFLTINQLKDPQALLHKLFLYLWDDVLRFRQNELFSVPNFSLVEKAWETGNGSPLKIIFEHQEPKDSAAEVQGN